MWHKLLFWHVFSNQTEVSKVLSVYVCVINSRPRSEVWLVELRRLLSNKEVIVPSAKCEAHMWLVQEIWQSRSIQQSQNAYPFCTIARLNFRFSLSLGLLLAWLRDPSHQLVFMLGQPAVLLSMRFLCRQNAVPTVQQTLRCLHLWGTLYGWDVCQYIAFPSSLTAEDAKTIKKQKKMKLQTAYSF